MTEQITRCFDCGYRALTHGSEECSKCGGKLEILASENPLELKKQQGDDLI